MFTLKIDPTTDYYEYICPFCSSENKHTGGFVCSVCGHFLDLNIEFIDAELSSRFEYYLNQESIV